MMKGTTFASLLLVGVVAILIVTAARGEEFEIHRMTIDGGGTLGSVGGELELSGTLGQPDAGTLSGGGFTLAGGFWFGQSPGDSNEDGGINLFDYSELETCVSGPGGGIINTDCAFFDLDSDQDVDLWDVGEFQRSFSGS